MKFGKLLINQFLFEEPINHKAPKNEIQNQFSTHKKKFPAKFP
jgi:hypothetical protein